MNYNSYYIPIKQDDKNKIEANSILFHVLALIAAAVLFIIPYGSIPIAKVFIPILVITLIITTIYGKFKKISLINIVSLLLLIVTSFFNYSLDRLAEALLLFFLLMVCQKENRFNSFIVLSIYFFSLLSILTQLSIYRYESLPVLSIIDPNYSGVTMLLFLFFSFKNRFKIGILLSLICSIFFLSRAYILCISVFLFLFIIEKKVPLIIKNIQKISWISLVIILNLFIFLYGLHFINNFEKSSKSNISRNSIERILSFESTNDESNYNRFLATFVNFETLIEEPQKLFFGIDSELTQGLDREEAHEIKKSVAGVARVHNTLFSLIIDRGIIYSILYLTIANKIVSLFYKIENFKYIMSYLVYSLLLHNLFRGYFFVFLIIIIGMTSKKIQFLFNKN